MIRLQRYHIQHFAYLLEKLRSTPEGDGNLLDTVAILYGGGISDGNLHYHDNLPLVLVGGAAGQIKGGRHLRAKKDTPLTNLHVSLLNMMGVPTENLADSTGALSGMGA